MGEGGLWLGEHYWKEVKLPTSDMVVRAVNMADLATNYPGLDKLERSRWGGKLFGTGTSFDRPLGFINHIIRKQGHPWVHDVFTRVKRICIEVSVSRFGQEAKMAGKGDDLIRKTLSMCESSIAQSGPLPKVLFSGMSTLGGPRGWEKETVIEMVKEWVQGETTLFSKPSDANFVTNKLSRWMDHWVGQGNLGDARKIGFESYKSDFMRWGTSGGCSPTTAEVKYAISRGMIKHKSESGMLRTKTICGMLAVLVDDVDDLLKKSSVCHAALKEETKTRVIISTPMWSYVRMCYVLDCLGSPQFLNSTLSRHDTVSQFVKYYSLNYAAVDASQFDHNVPLWLLKALWSSLEDAVARRFGADDELATICRELRGELDNLWIEVLGSKVQYRKGLLSGWRVTSLFGSIISALCCELYIDYASNNLNVDRNAIGYLTQGDDVILWSCADNFSQVIPFMQEIGVRTHSSKCLIGHEGDFLRGLYTREGKVNYPMRSLRGLFYAHPWIERRQYHGLAELSSNWIQASSRVQMWRGNPSGGMLNMMLDEAASDIARWGCGLKTSKIRLLLRTPTSLGGLGCLETDVGGTYLAYSAVEKDKNIGRSFSDLFSFVGMRPNGGYSTKQVHGRYVDMVAVNRAASKLNPWDEPRIAKVSGQNRAGMFFYASAKTSTNKEKGTRLWHDMVSAAEKLLGDAGRQSVDFVTTGIYGRTTRREDVLRLLFGGNPLGLVTSISLDLTLAREKMRWAEHLANLCLQGMTHRVSKTRVVAASWTVYLAMMRTDATFGQL